eukprot:Opistho-2@10061
MTAHRFLSLAASARDSAAAMQRAADPKESDGSSSAGSPLSARASCWRPPSPHSRAITMSLSVLLPEDSTCWPTSAAPCRRQQSARRAPSDDSGVSESRSSVTWSAHMVLNRSSSLRRTDSNSRLSASERCVYASGAPLSVATVGPTWDAASKRRLRPLRLSSLDATSSRPTARTMPLMAMSLTMDEEAAVRTRATTVRRASRTASAVRSSTTSGGACLARTLCPSRGNARARSVTAARPRSPGWTASVTRRSTVTRWSTAAVHRLWDAKLASRCSTAAAIEGSGVPLSSRAMSSNPGVFVIASAFPSDCAMTARLLPATTRAAVSAVADSRVPRSSFDSESVDTAASARSDRILASRCVATTASLFPGSTRTRSRRSSKASVMRSRPSYAWALRKSPLASFGVSESAVLQSSSAAAKVPNFKWQAARFLCSTETSAADAFREPDSMARVYEAAAPWKSPFLKSSFPRARASSCPSMQCFSSATAAIPAGMLTVGEQDRKREPLQWCSARASPMYSALI